MDSTDEPGIAMAGYLERFEREPANSRWPFVRKWLFDEPLPFFAELRTHRPILEMPELTLATRYDDCSLILREHDAFTVELYKPKQGDYWMAQDDTPVHWREKAIMQAVLDREQIPAIRTYVTDKAASLLKAAGGRVDAVDGLARAVPLALVQDWFGFVDSDPEELFEPFGTSPSIPWLWPIPLRSWQSAKPHSFAWATI
jgi:cytochrome P450